MADRINSVNSTNEQFETSTTDSVVSKRSRKLERKPLITERQGSCNGAGDGGSLGSSFTSQSADVSQQSIVVEQPVEERSSPGRTLGTLDGVFAPVALSQFSSLLFLRVGFLVGNGGLLVVLAMLFGAYAILILTVLSICAISTNGAVEGGGAYFMISRTLGPEMGGAIGIVFYTANVFSCALYTSGCVEGLLQGISIAMFPEPDNITAATNSTGSLELTDSELYLVGFGINVLLLCLCLIGARMFAKCTSAFFFTVCVITLVVFFSMVARRDLTVPYARSNHLNTTTHSGNFTGPSLHTLMGNLYSNFTVDYNNGLETNYKILFGVLFSGVTGIMAGANMSGELKDPGNSIPTGTVSACIFTLFVYCGLVLATAFTTANDVLVNNYVFMGYICIWKPLVYLGIVLATLCASLSNMIGASRVLRAIASDKIFGPLLTFLSYPTKVSCLSSQEFLGPLLMTFACTSAVLGIGDMNSIAPYASVFFLLSYATINVACIMLVWASAPNFRPKFKQYSMVTCFSGLATCLAMMLCLNLRPAFACMAMFLFLLICLYFYHIKHPSSELQWGSVGQAVLFHTVRKYLLKLDFRREHVKFWRPHLLLLVANPRSACPLIVTLNDLKKSGVFILGHVKVSDSSPRDLQEEYIRWQGIVDTLKVKAFLSLTESRSLREGALQTTRLSGLGALRPNTVLLGFRDDAPAQDFLTMPGSVYCMTTPLPSDWLPLKDHSPSSDESTAYDDEPSSTKGSSQGGDSERLSVQEYVALLQDILDARKNLALCRSFHLLDREALNRSQAHTNYVDVWPLNMLSPETSSLEDTTSLFTLQLGTILNMVKFWRNNAKLRVLLIVLPEWTPEFLKQQECKVNETLASLRVDANIVPVPWVISSAAAAAKLPVPSLLDGETEDELTTASGGAGLDTSKSPIPGSSRARKGKPSDGDSTNVHLQRMTKTHLTNVNKLIRNHGKDSAITFLNISPPPSNTELYPLYLGALRCLTNDIGPCFMVHGQSKVTTNML